MLGPANLALFRAPFNIYVATSEKKYRQLAKLIGCDDPQDKWISDGSDAMVRTFSHVGEEALSDAIVCCDIRKKHSKTELYALLAHEAMHVWRFIAREIGEDSPSQEFEAYAVQALCGFLFDSVAQAGKKSRRKKRR